MGSSIGKSIGSSHLCHHFCKSIGSSHLCLSPTHFHYGLMIEGVLLGLSNTAGVLAGVFGTAATGYILQKGSWDDVFKVSVALYIIGTIVWNIFSTGEKILE